MTCNIVLLSLRVKLKKRAIALVRSKANKRYREMQRISLPKSITFLNLLSMDRELLTEISWRYTAQSMATGQTAVLCRFN